MEEEATIYPLKIIDNFLNNCSTCSALNAIHINNKYYTYDEVLRYVKVVFYEIEKSGVEDFIGIYCEENIWTYASIIAVLISGAAYFPINPKLPAERINELLEESRVNKVITFSKINELSNTQVILINPESHDQLFPQQLISQPIAYLLFTSGTTGKPKGVPVSRENLNGFFEHCLKTYNFQSNDRFLQAYELSFDVSVFCIFSALSVGACFYVVPDNSLKYFNILRTIKSHQITVTSLVPTVLQFLEKYLSEFNFPHIRFSFFSGDKLYHSLAKKWGKLAPSSQIFNCYGPTETTIVCTEYLWTENNSEIESHNDIVPLGKPFHGTQFIIVDEKNQEIFNGIGELCISGKQVINGYWQGNEANRFFTLYSSRFYKTGDLVELNNLGNLIFHGRIDTQVKINGFRVELLEVEFRLKKYYNTKVAVIDVAINGLNKLVAFIETTSLIKRVNLIELNEIIPHYMIPFETINLTALPLNMNGKIDYPQLKRIYNDRQNLESN